MGDEIFPDEVMEIRVQMTKRYQEYLDPKPNGKATGQLVGSCNLPHFTVAQLIQLFLGGLLLLDKQEFFHAVGIVGLPAG